MVVCYALFYISTVFSLSYGVTTLAIPRPQFLGMLCVAVIFMAAATPLSAWAGDRYGRRPVLLVAGSAALLSGFLLDPMLGSGSPWLITVFLSIELFLMGATFAPDGRIFRCRKYFHFRALHRRGRSLQSGRHPRHRWRSATARSNWCSTGVELGGRLYFGGGGDPRIKMSTNTNAAVLAIL